MNPELISAIRERRALGHAPEMIREELAQAGYEPIMIDQALAAAGEGSHEPVSNSGNVVLPSASELLRDGWSFAHRYLDLALLLAAPFLLVEVVRYFIPAPEIIGLGTLLALLVYVVLLIAALRIVTIDGGVEKIALWSIFPWVREHLAGLLWLSFLTMLVIWGGFLLFVIPAIIVSLSVYVAQFVYVKEGVHGLNALLRSRELIQGYWWAIFGRVMAILFAFLGVLLLVGLVAGALSYATGGDFSKGGEGMLLFDLLSQLLSAVMTLVGLKVALTLYERLVVAKPAVTAASTEGRGGYLALAWLGVLFIALLVVVAATLVNSPNMQNFIEEDVFDEQAKQRAIDLRNE